MCGVGLVLPLERSASLPGLDEVPGEVQREEVHLQGQQDESVPQQSVRVTNYLPDEDVRVIQVGALLQANVLQHVVQIVHDAVDQRHERNRTDADHVLLHVVDPVAAEIRRPS